MDMTNGRKSIPKRICCIVIVLSLIVSCLGLFMFQEGPRTGVVILAASESHEIFLDPMGNETLLVSPLEERGLAEYSVANLTDFLLNRTIDVELQTVDQQTITIMIPNATELGVSKDLASHQGVLVIEGVNKLHLEFFPKHPWQSLQLKLRNTQNSSTTVNLEASQLFVVSVLRYDAAFAWLTAACVSVVVVFVLQLVLRVTPDDLPNMALRVMLPHKYRRYLSTQTLPSFWAISAIIGLVLVGTSIVLASRAEANLVLTANIWEDYWYRFSASLFLLLITMIAIVTGIRILWGFVYYPLCARYYPDAVLKKQADELFIAFMRRSLLARRSLIAYGVLGVIMVLLLNSGIRLELFLAVWMAAFLIFLAHVSSRAYVKSWRRTSSAPLHDFRFIRSSFGASFIVSVLFVYAFQLATPIIGAFSRGFLDKSVLVVHNMSKEWLLTSAGFAGYFKDVTPVFAYLVPISVTIFYYFFAGFSTIQLPAELKKHARSDVLADLAFFVLVFLCAIWLQSLFVQLHAQQVLISLASSFIAASFRNYLEAWRNVPVDA